MARDLIVVERVGNRSTTRTQSVESFTAGLKDGPSPVVLVPETEATATLYREMAHLLPALLAERRAGRHDRRIEALLDLMLEEDPTGAAEARIDRDNAQLRRRFLDDIPVLDAAGVHDRAGHRGTNKAQTAASWRRAGRILGLPQGGRQLYPAFQFDADGQPLPGMAAALAALPAAMTPWQRAFWFVSPNDILDGSTPADALHRADDAIIDAAREAGSSPIG